MNKKSVWIVFTAALLIVLPVRLYQILFLMDRKTGFYSDGGVTTAIVSITLAVGIIAMVVLSFMKRGTFREYQPVRSISAGVTGALAGLGVVFESAFGLMGGNGSQAHSIYVILSVIGIAAGVVIILTAYDFLTGENRFSKYPVLALIPSIWGCVALVALFITYVAVVNVSENVYDTFTVIFLLLFLFSQAKMLAGVESVKSSRRIYTCGIPAILLSLVTGIPGAVSFFNGTSQTSYFPVGLYFVNIVMALYIFAFLFAVSHSQNLPDGDSEPKAAVLEKKEDAEKAGTPSPELMEKERCLEFLGRVYQSKEMFVERS